MWLPCKLTITFSVPYVIFLMNAANVKKQLCNFQKNPSYEMVTDAVST